MTLNITEDICSITDLKRKTNSILEQIHRTERPVILTVNGKAEAVLMDAKEYEKMTGAFTLLKLLSNAEDDINNKKYKNIRTFFQEFKIDRKI